MRIPAALLAGAAITLALAGSKCAEVFRQPELEFRGLRINSIGLDGASLDIVVDVYNPNAYRLGLDRLSYDLAIENVHWGVGSIAAPIAVEGGDRATVRLPLSVSWSRLGDVGRDALRTGSVNYGVSGEMTVTTVLGGRSVPFRKSGRLSVLSGQESADPAEVRPDSTSRFRLARYRIEATTPLSKTTVLPTLL